MHFSMMLEGSPEPLRPEDLSLQTDIPIEQIRTIDTLLKGKISTALERDPISAKQLVREAATLFKNTNISVPPSDGGDGPEVVDVALYWFSAESGTVKGMEASLARGNEELDFLDFVGLFAADTFFPILFDVSRPSGVMIGIGVDAISSDGSAIEGALSRRNGCHFDMARFYRRNESPDLEGLYGGGIQVDAEGEVTIHLKSRGVNQTPDGHLEEALDAVLKEHIMDMFLADVSH